MRNSILATPSMAIDNSATVYYVSENGSDNNNGTENAPFKTVAKVNEIVAARNGAKTVICFKRGETFRGQLLAQSNVTYTAYGTGEKPIITVSPENGAIASKWTRVEGTDHVWVYEDEMSDVGAIFFNDGESFAVKQCPKIVNGAFDFGFEVLGDNEFMSDLSVEDALILKNTNAASIKGKVYLCCEAGNPGEVYNSSEFSQRLYVVFLPNYAQNVTVDNLNIRFGGAHGVGGSAQTNLLVQNCEVGYIGGGIQYYTVSKDDENTYLPARYGNGVEVNAGCNGYTVQNCWIHDIYDTGITHQQGTNHSKELQFKDVLYTNNLIENCVYSVEYFAKTSEKTGDIVKMINITISDNVMRNAGEGFCEQRYLLETGWNMGAHIMGWYNSYNYAENFVIKDNVFDRCIYWDLSNGSRVNSSFIVVAAASEEYLPTFEGNTYVHYEGSKFGYYGLNVSEDFTARYFATYTEDFSVADFLGDTTGEMFFIK